MKIPNTFNNPELLNRLEVVAILTKLIDRTSDNGLGAVAAILSGLCGCILVNREIHILEAMKPVIEALKEEADRELADAEPLNEEEQKLMDELSDAIGTTQLKKRFDERETELKQREYDFFDKNNIIQ